MDRDTDLACDLQYQQARQMPHAIHAKVKTMKPRSAH